MTVSTSHCVPYRPANGTEGDLFMASWCGHCRFNHATDNEDIPDDACDIQLAALALRIGDEGYPPQLRYRDAVPVCTAFVAADLGDMDLPYRCHLTPDLFRGPLVEASEHEMPAGEALT